MRVRKAAIPDIKIIEPEVFADERGYFLESFQSQRYMDVGIDLSFVQDNISRSTYGILRGLHYQLKYPQAKLVTVTKGEVFDVLVDIRRGSPTFGKWFGTILSDGNHKQLYAPPGFAHGFCVLSEYADFYYKCSDYYHSEDEYGVYWNDSAIGIKWPLDIEPKLSVKDAKYKPLADISPNLLPKFEVK